MPVDQNGNFYIGSPASALRIDPSSGKVTFNVGGTSTPVTGNKRNVGSLFKGTGVYAPRRRGGTADTMGRVVSTETTPSGGMATGGGFNEIGQRALNEMVYPTRLSAEDQANKIISEYLNQTTTPSSGGVGGGGGVSNPYTNAIKILQKQLGGGQYGTSYDNLSTLLGNTSATARGQIDQATADAIAQISRQNPLATPINYSAGTTQIPQTALNTYLNSIGASTGTVDAGRNFLQGLIDTSASSAAQSQAAQQQAYAAQRQAAIDALTGNQQLQQGNLASSTQAQQLAIASAKERERKALEDQILQYVLKGGVA